MSCQPGLESNQLKSFSLTIDGKVITYSQVISIKMKWSMETSKVVGQLIFRDFTGLIESIPIRGNNEIVMSMTDFEDEKHDYKFKVSNVTSSKMESGHLAVSLSFIDSMTVSAMNMYKSMSWSEASVTDVVNHDETLKPLMKDKEIDFASDSPKISNFVMPMHVSFNVTMNWLAKKTNVMIFQTRKKMVMQPVKELFKREQTSKFVYKASNQNYRRKIYEYESRFGDMLKASTSMAKGKVSSLDPNKKKSDDVEQSPSATEEDTGKTGKTTKEYETDGERHYYKSTTLSDTAGKQMWEKNAYKSLQLDILVPGAFATNIGDIVEIDFVNIQEQSEPEKNLSGLWIVNEVVDNIIPPDYIQRLTLVRAKYAE